METVLFLRSSRTLRPLVDVSSVYQRRNALGKHQMISLPIAARSQRRIVCTAAGSASTPHPPPDEMFPPEASNLRKTRTTLSNIFLAQEKPMPDLPSLPLHEVIVQELSKAETVKSLVKNFLKAQLATELEHDLGMLLVTMCIAMKQYQTAKELCGKLKEKLPEEEPVSRLQMAVIDMMLAVETMLEREPDEQKGIDQIELAKKSWKTYTGVHSFSGMRPRDIEIEDS